MDKTGPNPFSVWYTEVHSRDKTAIKPKWNTGFWNPDLCLTPGALSNGRGAFFLCFSVEQDSEAQGPQNSSHKFGAPICEILCLVPRKKPAPCRPPTGRPLFLQRSRPPGSPGCLVTKVPLVLTRELWRCVRVSEALTVGTRIIQSSDGCPPCPAAGSLPLAPRPIPPPQPSSWSRAHILTAPRSKSL